MTIKQKVLHARHKRMDEGQLRNLLLETSALVKPLRDTQRQIQAILSETAEWTASQSEPVEKLMNALQHEEATTVSALEAFTVEYHDYIGVWKKVLEARTELKRYKKEYTRAMKDAESAEKALLSLKHKEEVLVDKEARKSPNVARRQLGSNGSMNAITSSPLASNSASPNLARKRILGKGIGSSDALLAGKSSTASPALSSTAHSSGHEDHESDSDLGPPPSPPPAPPITPTGPAAEKPLPHGPAPPPPTQTAKHVNAADPSSAPKATEAEHLAVDKKTTNPLLQSPQAQRKVLIKEGDVVDVPQNEPKYDKIVRSVDDKRTLCRAKFEAYQAKRVEVEKAMHDDLSSATTLLLSAKNALFKTAAEAMIQTVHSLEAFPSVVTATEEGDIVYAARDPKALEIPSTVWCEGIRLQRALEAERSASRAALQRERHRSKEALDALNETLAAKMRKLKGALRDKTRSLAAATAALEESAADSNENSAHVRGLLQRMQEKLVDEKKSILSLISSQGDYLKDMLPTLFDDVTTAALFDLDRALQAIDAVKVFDGEWGPGRDEEEEGIRQRTQLVARVLFCAQSALRACQGAITRMRSASSRQSDRSRRRRARTDPAHHALFTKYVKRSLESNSGPIAVAEGSSPPSTPRHGERFRDGDSDGHDDQETAEQGNGEDGACDDLPAGHRSPSVVKRRSGADKRAALRNRQRPSSMILIEETHLAACKQEEQEQQTEASVLENVMAALSLAHAAASRIATGFDADVVELVSVTEQQGSVKTSMEDLEQALLTLQASLAPYSVADGADLPKEMAGLMTRAEKIIAETEVLLDDIEEQLPHSESLHHISEREQLNINLKSIGAGRDMMALVRLCVKEAVNLRFGSATRKILASISCFFSLSRIRHRFSMLLSFLTYFLPCVCMRGVQSLFSAALSGPSDPSQKDGEEDEHDASLVDDAKSQVMRNDASLRRHNQDPSAQDLVATAFLRRRSSISINLQYQRWLNAMDSLLEDIISITPIWIDVFQDHILISPQAHELRAATTKLASCSVHMQAFLKSLNFSNAMIGRFEKSTRELHASSHALLSHIRAAHEREMKDIKLKNIDPSTISELKAKRMVMESRAEMYRLEEALKLERERLGKLQQYAGTVSAPAPDLAEPLEE